MTGSARALPAHPSLRHLKVEARRRVKSGEFPALYEAQLAIAREHGQPSWAVLKELICGQSQPECHALSQLRWIITRFTGADAPGWAVPDEPELRQHFHDDYLTGVGAGKLVEIIAGMAADLREEYVVIGASPLAVQIQLVGWQVHAIADARPPHRLTVLSRFPLGRRIIDPRVAAPATRVFGEVPAAVNRVAAEAFTEIGLPGLVLAGARPDGPWPEGACPDGSVWMLARGWADLESASLLDTGHRFPVYAVTQLVTAMAALRLVADARVGLDAPANDYLRTVRLADGSVTVRELLTHTGGVGVPARPLAEPAAGLVAQVGRVLPCDGQRGVFRMGPGGSAALGQLVADITGSPYPDAVARLVFGPLGMTSSFFPANWPRGGAVAGYTVRLNEDGAFAPVPPRVFGLQAASGLWTTAADLVRFAVAWKSLLPEALAHEALRPQTAGGPVRGRDLGLGWIVSPRGDFAGIAGSGPGASTSLLVRDPARPAGCAQVQVALVNRTIPIEPLNLRLLRLCCADADGQPPPNE